MLPRLPGYRRALGAGARGSRLELRLRGGCGTQEKRSLAQTLTLTLAPTLTPILTRRLRKPIIVLREADVRYASLSALTLTLNLTLTITITLALALAVALTLTLTLTLTVR